MVQNCEFPTRENGQIFCPSIKDNGTILPHTRYNHFTFPLGNNPTMKQDLDNFSYRSGTFGGRDAILVNPNHSDGGWTKDNLHLRSVIYDAKTEEILSMGFFKYFNYGQAPDLYPNPEDFDDWYINTKIDGSTLVMDFLDNDILMRTRGIFDYRTQKNADDFPLIFEKYPNVDALMTRHRDYTMLFEIVTPNNRIVINYPEVDFYFIGAVHKPTMTMMDGNWLDELARIYRLQRPKKYSFKSLEDVSNIIKEWRDEEGVVVSYNNGLNKIKFKADRYCFLHRVMSGIRSVDDVLDKFIESGYPAYKPFFDYYVENFDYEIALELDHIIKDVMNAHDAYQISMDALALDVNQAAKYETRKDQAECIMGFYENQPLIKGVAFKLLDGKELDDKTIRKLMKGYIEDEK